jgi:hypothetical protein
MKIKGRWRSRGGEGEENERVGAGGEWGERGESGGRVEGENGCVLCGCILYKRGDPHYRLTNDSTVSNILTPDPSRGWRGMWRGAQGIEPVLVFPIWQLVCTH